VVEPVNCPRCASETDVEVDGPVVVLVCIACGWSLAADGGRKPAELDRQALLWAISVVQAAARGGRAP
jgi:transcription elongation factor Elf1